VTVPHPDVGLTHVALPVTDAAATAAFYARYADLQVVHRRVDADTGAAVAWLSDLTHPFVVVVIETTVTHQLGGYAHLGVGCSNRDDVDARLAAARAAGHTVLGPFDDGPPVGYWAIISDPDGHNLELSYGQEVGVTAVRDASRTAEPNAT
jgi:catechol 2,3-dioxygenase-like lactoylglutathione lyase family enzyme